MSDDSKIICYQKTLRPRFSDLQRRYGLTALAFFGSQARGEARPDSDLDVLAEFSDTPSLFRILELESELSELLGVRVDLALRQSLRPDVARHALAELVPL